MPVKRCSNGKWQIGSGPCNLPDKATGERLYHYLLSKGKIDHPSNSKARSAAAKQRMKD